MGHLGEAVPVPLVLSEPHTLGAGVSTVCGVAHAPALRHDRRQGRGGSSAYSKGVHDGRCSLLLCDTRTEMCCLDLEWRDTLCVHTAVRVAEYRASCVFCTLYVPGCRPSRVLRHRVRV